MSKKIHFLEDGYYVDKLEKEIQQLKEECNQLQTTANTYKEVINELNEALNHIDDNIMETCEVYDVNGIELKKILNKIKGEKNENS